jgi:hypothetical protein
VKRVILILILIMVVGAVAIGLQVLGANSREASPTTIGIQDSADYQVPAMASLQSRRFAAVPAYQAFATRSLHSMRMVAAPSIDGSLVDWPDGETIDLNRKTAFSYLGRISSIADLSAVIRSGWDEETLYFAIQVADDIIVADSSDVWRDDGVEIGLDGLYDRDSWGSDDHQYAILADGRTSDRAVPITDIVAAVSAHEEGYDIEVAIPMSQLLPGIPISGTVMGFTIGLHDDDDGDNWDAYLIWEGTTTSSHPEQFASLILTERIQDRIAALEAKLERLEQRARELLDILSEFERLTPP